MSRSRGALKRVLHILRSAKTTQNEILAAAARRLTDSQILVTSFDLGPERAIQKEKFLCVE